MTAVVAALVLVATLAIPSRRPPRHRAPGGWLRAVTG